MVVERPTAIYLVQEQPNPSTDFFVLPALQQAGYDDDVAVNHCGFSELPDVAQLSGAVIVFVRYIPTPWKRLVSAARGQIARVIYFMDDDLLQIRASQGMPWRYRFKLARLATLRKRWLTDMHAELWVSTAFLQGEYADWNPRLVTPKPQRSIEPGIRLFYHGSASHLDDIRWLYPIIKTLLLDDERLSFEIIGGPEVNRWFRSLPRVTVVHPMKWLAYQAFLAQPGRAIGLAPLLDLPFNQARSYTKFFDITQAGAIGVYARNPIFSEVVEEGHNGVLVDMDPQQWISAIKALVADESKRKTMHANALGTLAGLAG